MRLRRRPKVTTQVKCILVWILRQCIDRWLRSRFCRTLWKVIIWPETRPLLGFSPIITLIVVVLIYLLSINMLRRDKQNTRQWQFTIEEITQWRNVTAVNILYSTRYLYRSVAADLRRYLRSHPACEQFVMRHFEHFRNDVEFVRREIWHFSGSLYPSDCPEHRSRVVRWPSCDRESYPIVWRFHRL